MVLLLACFHNNIKQKMEDLMNYIMILQHIQVTENQKPVFFQHFCYNQCFIQIQTESNNINSKTNLTMKNTRSNDLDNLLYSGSQYDEEDAEADSLRKQLNLVQNKYKFNDKNMLNLDDDDEDDDGIVLGNGESIEEDQQRWGEDYKNEGRQWNHQQNVKYYFRQVAGNSENFSQSLSIHRPDLLQSKGMHENSVNLDSLNVQNILNAKKKQQQKVNQVLDIQLHDLLQKIQKQECLLKAYNKKIEELEEANKRLDIQNEQHKQSIRQYHQKLDKKDQLFNMLKDQYKCKVDIIDEQEKIQRQLRQNMISMEKQIQKLRNVIRSYTEQERGLMDFGNASPKRSESFKSTVSSVREKESMQAEIEKLRRQKKTLATECEIMKQDIIRKQQKFKNLEQDLTRKLSTKQKKLKQQSQTLAQQKQDSTKIKKIHDSSILTLKQKIIKLQRQLNQKQEKIRENENKYNMSIEEIKKKEEKIKQLLTQLSDKHKKIQLFKDQLSQYQARGAIQTKLQNDRENKIEKLEQEVKELKSQRFNLKRELENVPTNAEQSLKREISSLKKDNESLRKQVAQLNQNILSLQRESEAKDDKVRELKKKNDQLLKKSSTTTKKKSQDHDTIKQLTQQNQSYRQMLSKQTKQLNQYRKKAQQNQQLANKLYILQSRIKFNSQHHNQHQQQQVQNEYDLQQINEALKQQLMERQNQIEEMEELHQRKIQEIKELHMKETQRLRKQKDSLSKILEDLHVEMDFKEKSLDYMHQRFVQIQKQNAELKAKRNILHSSFYDESYEKQENIANQFYQNKISTLQKKIQSLNSLLKEKDTQLRKINTQRQNYGFDVSQLKNRIKDLQAMVISNQSMRRIAPESLTHEQTLDFLMKILRRIIKSAEMIRALSKVHDFKPIIGNLWKTLDKDQIKR